MKRKPPGRVSREFSALVDPVSVYKDPIKMGHWFLMAGTTVILFFLSIFLGRYSITPQETALTFFSGIGHLVSDQWPG